MKYFLFYLALVNLVAAILFFMDKKKAQDNKWRIPEKTLHVFELMGGVFTILVMMYIIRHKNQKRDYFMWTYLIFGLWLGAFFFAFSNLRSLW